MPKSDDAYKFQCSRALCLNTQGWVGGIDAQVRQSKGSDAPNGGESLIGVPVDERLAAKPNARARVSTNSTKCARSRTHSQSPYLDRYGQQAYE